MDIQLTQGKVAVVDEVDADVAGVGMFEDPVEAAKAYDRAAFGEFAVLNFPRSPSQEEIQSP